MTTKKISYFFIGLICLLTSCTKDFLDKKPNKALLVPTTLTDFQALIAYPDDINISPGLNVISSDDFYRTDNTFIALTSVGQNTYTWAKDLYGGTPVSDWNKPYNQVFVANIVLDGLKNIKPDGTNQNLWNTIKGGALFIRAFAFYNLAQEFAAPYEPASAINNPGIPIRLTADVNIIAPRGTLEQAYQQIIADLSEANDLLPVQAALKNIPSKPAASALLARVYQTMQDYAAATKYATSCLLLTNKLIDYNTLSRSASRPLPSPLPNANDEVIYYCTLISSSSYNSSSSTLVDTVLYNSYSENDLRKAIYFNNKGKNNTVFKGNYTGSSAMFSGLAVDEVYLIRAECSARLNDVNNAMNDLNTVLAKRWLLGTFVPYTADSPEDALKIILTERRKELIARGLRWTDLRRLNMDTRFATTLNRMVNGKSFTLLPQSKNYVLPIPDDEINNSGIVQNPRN